MGQSDESFLPQIVGIFYAIFDPSLGPTVVHQVPERLISVGGDDGGLDRRRSRSGSRSVSRSRARSPSVVPGARRAASRERSTPASRFLTLLDFAPISEYVIPKKALHGKLVTFCTPGAWDEGPDSGDDDDDDDDDEALDTREGGRAEYKVIGLPMVIDGQAGQYQRNQYMWNLCFVFRADASLEAFEPVVRKTARILKSAEVDSGYLSSPAPQHTPLLAMLEQLFEDLNSYSETSIPLDGFNSLELKLFPFYPNPPEVHDWDVPVPLVNLNALKDDNWDITAARVSQYINGINHSAKIAQLADVDPALTRETLRHMLFYQVIMMIDIFQYSNIYTVTPAFARLCADESVMDECGAYVTRPGYAIADWPALATLYTKLHAGTTVHQWAEAHHIWTRGIDPRRFVSFGIIKGFMRRVHRWPVIIEKQMARILIGAAMGPSDSHPTTNVSGIASSGPPDPTRRRVGFHASNTYRGGGESREMRDLMPPSRSGERTNPFAGESQFTLRSTGSTASITLGGSPDVPASPPLQRRSSQRDATGRSFTSAPDTHPSISSRRTNTLRSAAGMAAASANAISSRQRERLYDLDIELLNSHHHTDEIQVRLGMSWAQLEKVLGLDGRARGVGSKGVAVVYR